MRYACLAFYDGDSLSQTEGLLFPSLWAVQAVAFSQSLALALGTAQYLPLAAAGRVRDFHPTVNFMPNREKSIVKYLTSTYFAKNDRE